MEIPEIFKETISFEATIDGHTGLFKSLPANKTILIDNDKFEGCIERINKNCKEVVYVDRANFFDKLMEYKPDIVILTFTTARTVEFVRTRLPEATIYVPGPTEENLKVCTAIEDLERITYRPEEEF